MPLILSVLLAFTMMPVAALGTAYASDDEGIQTNAVDDWTVTFKDESASVVVGQQIDMDDLIDLDKTGAPSGFTYHIDWFIVDDSGTLVTSTDVASINKHSGILTGSAPGTVTVRASLIQYGPQQKQGLCGEVKAYADKTVTVTAPPAEYGFQGGSNAIKMISPTVTSFSGSMDDGFYTNTINSAPISGGYVYFTVESTAGFKVNGQPGDSAAVISHYLAINGNNVTLMSGGSSWSLGDTTQAVLTISSIDADNNRVTFRVADSFLANHTGTLTFSENLQGNNANRKLGVEVTFDFHASGIS